MFYVTKTTKVTFEEKKSKFIAYLSPFENFDNLMKELKKEYPKARHFVYAYRYLNEFDQIVENSSDDGEPKGTSGKPTLNTLIGAELINSCVIIVRFFGGIKLGTGGLVRAYTKASNLSIQESKLLTYQKLFNNKIFVKYPDLGTIEYQLEQFDIKTINKNFIANGVELTIESTKEKIQKFQEENNRLLNILLNSG